MKMGRKMKNLLMLKATIRKLGRLCSGKSLMACSAIGVMQMVKSKDVSKNKLTEKRNAKKQS
jgi:hypothetical protein